MASDTDSLCPVYTSVELVRLRVVKRECDVCLAKGYVSTTKVLARGESIHLVHFKVVLLQETKECDQHCPPDDHNDGCGPVDVRAHSHAHE